MEMIEMMDHKKFAAVDPISALTHFGAFLFCLPALPALLIRAVSRGCGILELISLSVYMMTMIMLYGASAAYHTFDASCTARLRLKQLDHAMIYLMIAGSYTPMCTMVLERKQGIPLLILVWVVAFSGLVQAIFFVNCRTWISSILYIVMGWLAVLVMGSLWSGMTGTAFAFLLSGGILYTVGGVIYAMKFRLSEEFGAHELFHIFVMMGSFLHYLMMFGYVVSCR